MKSKSHKRVDGGRKRRIEGDGGDKERVGAVSKDVESDGGLSRNMRNSRDSARPRPIRLGGKDRKSCLSLDQRLNDSSTDGLRLADTQATSDADLIPCLNLREAAKAAQLTRRESAALLHTQRGTPLYKLANALRCRPCQAKRALETAQLKIRNLQRERNERDRLIDYIPVPDSVRLTFRERSVRGRPYALISLDQLFVEIMAEEKFFGLVSQRDPGSYEKRRVGLGAGRGRLILFAIEVREEEVRIEELRLAHLRNWQSPKALEAMARDRVRVRLREEAEAAERARINGLSDANLSEELRTCESRRAVLMDTSRNAEKKLAKLRRQRQQQQSANSVREIVAVIGSGLIEAEQDVERIERELATESWRLAELREAQAYRVRQTVQRRAAVAAKQAQISVTACIKDLEKYLEPFSNNLAALSAEQIGRATRIRYATSVLTSVLADIAESGERETKS
jgi:hypothetical protein